MSFWPSRWNYKVYDRTFTDTYSSVVNLHNMRTNLELLKTIGWQALDLTPPSSAGNKSSATEQNNDGDTPEIWSTLFDHAPCAIAIADHEERLMRVNRTLCTLAGYTPAELIGHQLEEIISKFGTGGCGSLEAKNVGCDSRTGCECICAISRLDRTKVWCRQTTVPCGNQGNEPHWTIRYFDELRNPEEVLQLLVTSHERFAKHQSTCLETVSSSFGRAGRPLCVANREELIPVQQLVLSQGTQAVWQHAHARP